MNILLTSVGRRGYLVRYFKEALDADGRVFGVDSSPCAPGMVYCDRHAVLPRVDDDGYMDTLLDYCRKHRIDVVIPLLDPELELLAGAKQRFAEAGVLAVISPSQTVQTAYDKYLTYEFAVAHGLAVPQTFLRADEALDAIAGERVPWPLVVKPRKGSASMNISYCRDKIQLAAAMETCPEPMIQEFLKGDEYGYDLFGDADGRPISVYCKKKLAMRAGETDKAVSTNNPDLIAFGAMLLEQFNLIGPADVDVVVDKDGPKLLEINPRFGGGYPCAHLAGAAFPHKVLAMRRGEVPAADIGACPEGVCMLKQDEIIQPDWDGLKG